MDLLWKVKERKDPLPASLPHIGHHLVLGIPAPELGQNRFGPLGGRRPVDRLQIRPRCS